MCTAPENIDTLAQAHRYQRLDQAYLHRESHLDLLSMFLLVNACTAIAIHSIRLL